eukprot:GHVU01110005.1.p2 GENE.GHVU01110005.1~~GHVU01110005.1.p2  ORF type:complete len:131 (-),score=14.38 GHVU01110005.1:536-928(-)
MRLLCLISAGCFFTFCKAQLEFPVEPGSFLKLGNRDGGDDDKPWPKLDIESEIALVKRKIELERIKVQLLTLPKTKVKQQQQEMKDDRVLPQQPSRLTLPPAINPYPRAAPPTYVIRPTLDVLAMRKALG